MSKIKLTSFIFVAIILNFILINNVEAYTLNGVKITYETNFSKAFLNNISQSTLDKLGCDNRTICISNSERGSIKNNTCCISNYSCVPYPYFTTTSVFEDKDGNTCYTFRNACSKIDEVSADWGETEKNNLKNICSGLAAEAGGSQDYNFGATKIFGENGIVKQDKEELWCKGYSGPAINTSGAAIGAVVGGSSDSSSSENKRPNSYTIDSVGNYSSACNTVINYGELSATATYPGGPYTVKFPYSAAISCTYLTGYTCKYIKYKAVDKTALCGSCTAGENGDVTCSGEEPATPKGNKDNDNADNNLDPVNVYEHMDGIGYSDFTIPKNWEYHPLEVKLTEKTIDNKKIDNTGKDSIMKFIECNVCNPNDPNHKEGINCEKTCISTSAPSTSGFANDTKSITSEGVTELDPSKMTDAAKNSEYEFGADPSNSSEVYNKIGEFSDGTAIWAKYNKKEVERKGEFNITASFGEYCDSSQTAPSSETWESNIETSWEGIATANMAKMSDFKCTPKIEDNGSCDCDDEGNCQGTVKKKTVTCKANWDGSYIIYSEPSYKTVTESISGNYVLQNDPNFSDRFNTENKRFTPPSILTGDYVYSVYDNDIFGERLCDLHIKSPGYFDEDPDDDPDNPENPDDDPNDDPGKHWSDFIYFRNVEVYNLFPNRQPGRNWEGYDLSIVPSNQVSTKDDPDVMYHIELSSSAMRKIAKNTTINDYIGWDLKEAKYKPFKHDGSYDWFLDHGYVDNGFKTLKEYGVIIDVYESKIQKRNKELIENGYNKYYTGK